MGCHIIQVVDNLTGLSYGYVRSTVMANISAYIFALAVQTAHEKHNSSACIQRGVSVCKAFCALANKIIYGHFYISLLTGCCQPLYSLILFKR